MENRNHKDAKDLATGALFNFLGMLARLSKVLFVFVVAKFYGVTALGLYFLAWSVVDISSKFGLWGLDKNLVRDIARFNRDRTPETNQRIFSTIYFSVGVALLLSVLVAAIVFLISPWVAAVIFKDMQLVVPVRVLSLALPFVVLSQVFIATTKGLRLMQYDVLVRQGIEPLVLLAGAVVLMPMGLGAIGLVIAHVFASFAAALSAFVVVLHKYKYLGWTPKPLKKEMKVETLRYIYPIATMDFINVLVSKTDIILVGALMDSTAAGLYGIAVEVISVIKNVRQGLEPIFSPIVSELFYSKQKGRLRRNYVLVTRWLMSGSFLPACAIVMFPAQILSFFNVDSAQATSTLVVLAVAYGLLVIFSAAESLLVMTGKTLLNTLLVAIMLLVNFLMTYWLIPRMGLVGAAVGTLASVAVVSVARLYYGQKQFGLLPFSPSLAWPPATALLTAALFYLLKSWLKIDTVFETVAVFVAMILTYVTIFFSGPTETEEKRLVKDFKVKIRKVILLPEKT